MAVNKNFVVKNGLEVDTSTLFVDSTNNYVAIGTTVPTVALDVRGKIKSDSEIETWNARITGIATMGAVGVTTVTSTDLVVTGFSTLGFASAKSLDVVSGFTTVQAFSSKDLTVSIGATISGDVLVSSASTFSGPVTIGGTVGFGTTAFFDDNVQLRFGTGAGDLKLYHDGSNSYIEDSGTGELRLRGTTIRLTDHDGSENFANFNDDGAVELFYNNTKRIETSPWGAYITGIATITSDVLVSGATSISGALDVTGVSTFTGAIGAAGAVTIYNDTTFKGDNYDLVWDKSDDSLEFGDGAQARFGASNDLQIYHTAGNNSYIKSNTNDLQFLSDETRILSNNASETIAIFSKDGAVSLYYNDSKKFETIGYGVTTGGMVGAAGTINSATDIQIGDVSVLTTASGDATALAIALG